MLSKNIERKQRVTKHNDHYLVTCGGFDMSKYKLTGMHGDGGTYTQVVEHPKPVRALSLNELFFYNDVRRVVEKIKKEDN
jgi:hypothetical protein